MSAYDELDPEPEPEIEEAAVGRRVVSNEPDDDSESAASEPAGRKGSLLTRLLPGRDKEGPERKALPVSKRSAGSDGEEDDDDFEF